FEHTGNKYFISGKTFFQSHSTVLITPETDIDIDKRSELRLEVPSLPGTISHTSGVFHKKHTLKCTIINMSLKGARVETSEQLSIDIPYALEIFFPYHHTTINFLSSFLVKNFRHYRNIYIHGISFINMDPESEGNLKKYLFGGKKLF
ncbi:MAG: PilZ domain-containing protein, partial [Candidatus Omnitrophica bacterium]|nr:PilZ domain-containing protein [Candidatus Omnitrophota bacterium]